MKWFRIQALEGNPRAAHVVIDKPIGSDWAPDWIQDLTGEKSASEFIAEVEALGEIDEITLEINSPGGDVASGLRIFNYLLNHRATIHVRVTGMACSIATVIMMAGDTRTMAIGTTIMVHRAAQLMIGFYTADEMEHNAQQIRVIDASIVDAFVLRTGKSVEEIASLLDQGDTYMGAGEAIEWGFATDRDDQVQAVASADMRVYHQQLEQAARNRQTRCPDNSSDNSEGEPLQLIASELGLSMEDLQQAPSKAVTAIQNMRTASTADGLRSQHPELVEVIESGVRDEAVKTERNRVGSIIKACQTAGQTQLIDRLIDNGMGEEQASEYIYDVAAAGGNAQHVNGSHSPEGGHQAAGIDYQKIYANRNCKTGKR